MKNKVFKMLNGARCIMPMNLQHFAEGGDGTGAEGGNGGGTGAEGGEGSKDKPLSFDDFLKGEGNQAEFDRRVNKAINTALENAREKWQTLTDDKVSEAEKLSKMTSAEKAQYMQQKKEKELSDREQEITRKELKAEAKNTLAEKKLPASLADLLVYTDAEACKNSIATLEKAFQSAVEAAVNEKLKGGDPAKKPQGSEDNLESEVERIMRGY